MSNIINKVKDAISGENHTSATTHTGSTNAGPHSSNVGNKADPRIDSDLDNRGTHGTHSGLTGTTGTTHGSTNAGPHNSNVANKADPRIDSDLDNRGTHGTHSGLTGTTGTTGGYGSTTHGSTNAGPHNSNIANKIDPRVDSDLDNRGTHGSHTTHGTHSGVTGTTGTTGGYGSTTHGSTNAGPHSSNVANKADPRVDSDLDNRGTHSTHTGTTGAYGTTGTTGGYGSTTHGSTNAGPHSSNLANKADPRVDSDLDNRGTHSTHTGTHGTHTGTTGSHGTHTGTTGTHGTHTGTTGTTGTTGGLSHSTNAGPHNSNIANQADPRVDSDRDGRAGIGSGQHATPGSGRAQNTAGPHNSDVLNKLDPRVDSDLDGSKTYGGNKTHAGRDPHDAAQVPPSVMAQAKGDRTIDHDSGFDHSRRHGSKTEDTLRQYGGGD